MRTRRRALYRRPVTRFTAEFLGETNLLPGELRRLDESTFAIVTEAGELQSTVFDENVTEAGNVTVSIRPECFAIEPGGGSTERGGATLQGRLQETVFLGEIAQHHVQITENVVLKVLELNPNSAKKSDQGERVTLSVAPEDVVLLSD